MPAANIASTTNGTALMKTASPAPESTPRLEISR